MADPQLSVVMPTHNRTDQLLRAATSVLAQGSVDLELIIVDDASDPGNEATLERIATDGRVRIVRNPVSLGPGGARNKGIELARGDYLAFCDDDDALLPGAADALVAHLRANPELGAVSCWHQVVHPAIDRVVDYRGPLRFGAGGLRWFNFVAIPFGVIRRADHPDGVWFDPELPTCEDWDVWLRCAERRPFEVVPLVLYSYYQHGGARVTKVEAGRRSGLQTFLDLHADSMTPACRAYHRAVLAEQVGGRRGMARQLVADTAGAPVAAGLAAAVLACSAAMSPLGIRRADPGLAARSVHHLLAAEGQDAR